MRRIRFRVLGCLAAITLALAGLALAAGPASAAYVFERKWGSEGSGNGQFRSPRSVAVNSRGDVYVVDAHNFRVQLFDSSGRFITKWGGRGSGDGRFGGPVGPWGVAADDAGRVYVADYNNGRVQRFLRFGDFRIAWGSGGSGNGQFDNPMGVAIGLFDTVFVTDRGNDRVQKFSRSGAFLDKWGSEGAGNGQFDHPDGVAINSRAPLALGEVYVADQGNHRIQKFNRFGSFLDKWGAEGSANGQFRSPRGPAVDAKGDVYVADSRNHRIQKFDSSGAFIAEWGSRGTGNGRFRLPTAVAVDSQGNVYVTDRFNHRVQKFRVVLPQTGLVSPPADPTNDPTPTFRFFSSRSGSSFECQMDAGSVFPCASPHRFSALSEGEHTFRVRATDGDGHTDPTPATRRFTVDTVPPETTIEAGPTETSADPRPSFAFSSSEAGSSFECALDGDRFARCNSPHAVGRLPDGVHRFSVRATDEAGNTDATPAVRVFTVDTSVDPLPGDFPPAAATLPARLEITRATVRGARAAQRRLVVRGRLHEAAADERVALRYRAGGEQIRLRPRVREDGRFRVGRLLRGEQRRTRSGRLSVLFAGTDELRPARAQLRVSRRAVRLRLDRDQPQIRGSRVIVAGRVVRRARGRVRIAVAFTDPSGAPAEIGARAKVNRRGRFRARLLVPAHVRDQGAWVSVTHPGRGPLHGQRIGAEAAP